MDESEFAVSVAVATVLILLTAALSAVVHRQSRKKLKNETTPIPPVGATFFDFVNATMASKVTDKQIEWVKEYGEVFSLPSPFPLLFRNSIMVADATVAKELLIKQANMYHPPSNFSSRPPALAKATRDSVGTSVTGLVGEEWRWRKDALLKEFHRSRMMSSDRELLDAIVRAGEELCEKLDKAAETGEAVKVDTLMTRCAVKVILYFLFGRDLDFDPEEFARAAKDMMNYMVHRRMQPLHPILKYLPGKCHEMEEKKRAAWNVFDNLTTNEIQLLLKENEGGPVAPDRKPGCVMASLIANEPRFREGGIDSMKAEARVFVLAGFETTAHSLSFGFGMLAEHPALADQLAKEGQDALAGQPITANTLRTRLDKTERVKHFFLEAIRLYPLAPLLGGYCKNDIVMTTRKNEKYLFPKGTEVYFANMVMQRHAVFSKGSGDPLAVEPDRWNVPVAEQPFLNTFNNGAHACPGKNLSLLEGQTFLLMACTRYRFEFPADGDGKVHYTENMLLRPKDSMPLIVKRRD